MTAPYTGRVVALIPARGGSKGIANKNLQQIGGYSLVSLAVAAGILSTHIDAVVLTTDSKRIAEEGEKYGASVPFLRPAEISQDGSTDKEFFAHYSDFVAKQGKDLPELIVHIRPTTPLRDVRVIDDAIKYMLGKPQTTSLRSMSKTAHIPYKMFKKEGEFSKPFLELEGVNESANLPRQHFPEAYIPNGYVDIVRPEILIETNTLHGKSMKLFESSPVPDIDDIEDLQSARQFKERSEFAPLFEYLQSKDLE